MKFHPGRIPGLVEIELEKVSDERGHFARTWCQDELAENGITHTFVQDSVSANRKKGTLRGMHLQQSPFAEAKLIRCSRGSIYDVILDLRADSPTYLQWQAIELSERNLRMLFVPEGLAHGFQTLEDDAEVSYRISETYNPEYASGVRWNDPAFAIEWPETDHRIMSDRDRNWPDYPKD